MSDFSPNELAPESNLFVIYAKFRLVTGRNFCFIRPKAGYHFRRLGNWNCLNKQ